MVYAAIAGLVVLGLGLRFVLKRGHMRGAKSIGAFKTSASGAPHVLFGSVSHERLEDQSEPGDGGDGGGGGGGADSGGDGGE